MKSPFRLEPLLYQLHCTPSITPTSKGSTRKLGKKTPEESDYTASARGVLSHTMPTIRQGEMENGNREVR